MRLFTAILSRQGNLSVTDGVTVFESKAHDGIFYHLLIGRPNLERCFTRVPLGNNFSKNLPKRQEPCPNDGDGTLGVCKHCALNITPERIEGKTIDYTMGNGIDVWKNVARHAPVEFLNPIKRGSFILTKEKKTLLLVEELSKSKDKRIALLLYVEPGIGGSSSVEPRIKSQSPILAGIHDKAVGQRWLGKNPKVGIGVERLMILSPGDFVYTSQEGQIDPKDKKDGLAAYKIVVLPNGALDTKKVEATPSVPHPVEAPKEEPKPAEMVSDKALEPSEVAEPADGIVEGAQE
jgi:hypothetical protein